MRRLPSYLLLTFGAVILWLVMVPLCWLEVITRALWSCLKATMAATDMILSYIRSVWRT